MPTFTYQAWDRAGQPASGTIAARSISEAREMVRNKDLFVTELTAERAPAQSLLAGWSGGKIKLFDLVIMSRQLATLVHAGLPIVESLQSVAAQSENQALAKVISNVRLEIMTGSTVSEAMRLHPQVFNEMYTSLTQAGEAGGVLDQTLEIAATQLDREAVLREKVRSAFVYPAIVVIASFLVVLFMLVFIVPVFAKVYDQFHAQLPPITRLLVAVSAVFVHYGWLVALAAVISVLALMRYVRTPRGRTLYDSLKLKLPLLGKLNRKIAIARFTQTLAGAVSAGVPILAGLKISANTSGNVIIIEAVNAVTAFVKEGAMLSVPMEQSGQFPPMVTKMIAAGEQSGNLDEMLDEVTKFYQRDIEYSVDRLTRLMEPIMTVVVGVIVLFVLLSLYMPIFNLTQVIKK